MGKIIDKYLFGICFTLTLLFFEWRDNVLSDNLVYVLQQWLGVSFTFEIDPNALLEGLLYLEVVYAALSSNVLLGTTFSGFIFLLIGLVAVIIVSVFRLIRMLIKGVASILKISQAKNMKQGAMLYVMLGVTWLLFSASKPEHFQAEQETTVPPATGDTVELSIPEATPLPLVHKPVKSIPSVQDWEAYQRE